jgi:NTP pyrophosphatase (non-canonical NTP hydrolase)
MTAVAGEVGEAANIVKKLNRVRDGIPGNKETEAELRAGLADEIADAVIYLDLLAQAAGFDLETIRDAKFDKTSAKIGYVAQPAQPDPREAAKKIKHEEETFAAYYKFKTEHGARNRSEQDWERFVFNSAYDAALAGRQG